MFDSVIKVLGQYIKIDNRQLWRFDIYSIEAERGEDSENLYYLCNIRGSWCIVFETDYIFSLEEAANEAAEIFGSEDAKITHWLTKQDEAGEFGTLPLEAARDKTNYDKLVLDVEGTYLRCAVLAVEVLSPKGRRYDPMAYGYSS